jgi:hypothetical protein
MVLSRADCGAQFAKGANPEGSDIEVVIDKTPYEVPLEQRACPTLEQINSN